MEDLKFLLSHTIDQFDLNNITDEVIKKYKKSLKKGSFIYCSKEVNFELNEKTKIITIYFKGIKYHIKTKPYLLYYEEKNPENLLGEVYDIEEISNFFEEIETDYNFYLGNNLLLNVEEILKNENCDIIIKNKINLFLLKKFKCLNKKKFFSPDLKTILYEDKNELSPSPELELNYLNENLNLVLEKRNEFIKLINNFMNNKDLNELKIFGCDGIGKTMTYLYLSNIYNEYKILYFNIKKVTPDQDGYNLFIKEIMRYFTISHEFLNDSTSIETNYNNYSKEMKPIENLVFNFWKELAKFLDLKRGIKTLVIIDQFKETQQNLNGLIELEKLLLWRISRIKLLISYSINDSNTEEIINYLQKCSQNSSEIIVRPKIEKIDPFEKKFENVNLNNKVFYNENTDDNFFEKILVLNNEYGLFTNNNNINDNENDNNEDSITEDKITNISTSNINENIINDFGYNRIKKKIIYINSLVSLEKIIEEKYKKYLKIFDFNPKYYVKFMNFIKKQQDENIDNLYQKFLEKVYEDIKYKIASYYKRKGYNILSNETIDNLIILKDLIDNKIEFTSPILISYAKNFPMKYIKIKIKKSKDDEEEQNIIDLNNQFNNKKFYLDYCFPFIKLILSKIIYMSDNNYSINFKSLSGSAIGSFIEQKFKRSIVFEKCFSDKIELRYVWNFSILKEYDNKFIDQIDYNNFKEIVYDENIKNLNLSKIIYYIVPGSQINKSLDAAILIPYTEGVYFSLITLQLIKSKDYKIKEKEEYENAPFIAKDKFERLYKIKIKNVYFYFVLPNEFKTGPTIKDLIKKNISYILFSIQNNNILEEKGDKEHILSSVYELINEDSEIFGNSDFTEKDFGTKINSIARMELLLKKRRNQGIKISRNMYENARFEIFKKDKGITITNQQRNEIIKKIKFFYKINYDFTIKYIFKIRFKELFELKEYKDLFGLFKYQKTMCIYHKNFVISLDEKQNNIFFLIESMNEIERDINSLGDSHFHYSKERILLDQAKEREIYVFKIFKLFK